MATQWFCRSDLVGSVFLAIAHASIRAAMASQFRFRCPHVHAAILAILLAGCSDRDAIQKQAQGRIAAELSRRQDIPAADRNAAAAAIASHLVDVAEEGAALQPQVDADNAALDAKLGGVASAKARECEQLALELDTLRRMQSTGVSANDAEKTELSETIQRTEARFAQLCRPV